ncbi:hypothetical protein KKC88_00975 [Patescibacteria group bacterium]|nr:hypothetical protein [Patescibacteria group bacterium]MBU1673332.1 hypothetical protein [Patescibacteria group bacterium]MBU1963549.1 hypothetical protein [Patescibacteria group bacterium]
MDISSEDELEKLSDEELEKKIQEVDGLIAGEKNRRQTLLADLHALEEEFKKLSAEKDQAGIEELRKKIMES